MGGFSIWHWMIVLVIVVLIFGTKRLTGGAKDLGSAVKEFKKAVRDENDTKPVDSKITDPNLQAMNPAQQPADATKALNPPMVAPGDDSRPRG